MSAFLYGFALQWRLDVRSKSLLLTYYVVPLIFFLLMSGIFISVMPEMRDTLIPSMTVMGVSMGTSIGFPSSLAEAYQSDVKKVYAANGVPLCFSWMAMFLSSMVHLLLMCLLIMLIAPMAFGAALPENIPLFFAALAIYIAASLGVGSVLGLAVRQQGKLTMLAQLVFLPSVMLSGIMFPAELLPRLLKGLGQLFPATWGYRALLDHGFRMENLWYFAAVLVLAAVTCGILLKKQRAR